MSEWWNVPCRLAFDRYLVFSSPGGKDLVADVLRPDTDETLPGMIVVAGGGWRVCGKRNLEPFSVVLASWGYVTMNLTYRVAPEDQWPACMQDVKTGVRWLRANAEKYGLDPAHIGSFGNSAGAHLAAMLAVTPPDEHFGGTEYADQASNVQAAICISATVDMLAQREFRKDVTVTVDLFGGTPEQLPEVYRQGSPITYVSSQSAPIFFVHGLEDPIVPLDPVREMSGKLREAGVDSPLVIVEGQSHGVMKQHLYVREGQSHTAEIREFLEKHLKR